MEESREIHSFPSKEIDNPPGGHRMYSVCVVLLLITVAATFLMGSVPPVSRDALTHHLAVPKLYLKHGGIYETPTLFFSYYPMNIDLLYLLPLYLHFDIGAKYIHYAFALMTAWFIFRYLKKYAGTGYGMFGALLFLTIPVILKLSITVYVDLGLIFFSWLSLYYFLSWCSEGFRTRHLVLSAISCGLALGTKYNGMILLFLMAAMVPLAYSLKHGRKASSLGTAERYQNSLRGMKWCLAYLSIALLIFSPWMIRNYRWTGNPVYPLYKSIFNGHKLAPSESRMSVFEKRHLVYGESFFQIVTIPVRIFFEGKDDNPKYFDGALNPFLFLLPVFAFWGLKRDSEFRFQLKILLVFSVLFIVVVWLTSDMRIRYMSPAIPPLVILTVIAIRNIAQQRAKNVRYRWVFVTAAILISTAAIGCNFSYAGKLFAVVDPVRYLNGSISRDNYIMRFRAEYPVIKYANRHLPQNARVLCMMIGNRSYYLDRDFALCDLLFQQYANGRQLPKLLSKIIAENRITHIVLGENTYMRWANSVLNAGDRSALNAFFQKNTNLMYERWGYQLLSVKSSQLKGDQS